MRQDRPEFGSFGEYALVKKSAVIEIPEAISFEVAVTLPCLRGTATQVFDGLRDAIIDGGKKQAVFVQGAHGSVARIIVQLLKIRYHELLVIGSSPREVDLGTFTAIVTEEEPLRGKPIVRFSKDKDIGAKREQLIRTTTEQPLRG
jgi:NADPH:quinone reductase-like Zn-dependent oxidoreductase